MPPISADVSRSRCCARSRSVRRRRGSRRDSRAPGSDRSPTSLTRRISSCSNSVSPPTPTTPRTWRSGRLRARRARPGEITRRRSTASREPWPQTGRGLGDTGEDCVIVDGDDTVLGLAGIMGGASSEISATTTDVLLEAAYFDPMSVARSSKRHGLAQRGVQSIRARRRSRSSPCARRRGSSRCFARVVPTSSGSPTRSTFEARRRSPPTISVTASATSSGSSACPSPLDEAATLLRGLNFEVSADGEGLARRARRRRDPTYEVAAAGRADVIEEIARLYGYRRIPRRTPTWPEPGGLTARQKLRRRVRDIIVDLGAIECWTPTLGSDAEFDLLHRGVARVRITNPLAVGRVGVARHAAHRSRADLGEQLRTRHRRRRRRARSATFSRTRTSTDGAATHPGRRRRCRSNWRCPRRTSASPSSSGASTMTPRSAVALWATLAAATRPRRRRRAHERAPAQGLAPDALRRTGGPDVGRGPRLRGRSRQRPGRVVLSSVGTATTGRPRHRLRRAVRRREGDATKRVRRGPEQVPERVGRPRAS